MICSTCNGEVIWVGPMTNLTYTVCQSCGRTNNQIVDQPEEVEDDSSNPN